MLILTPMAKCLLALINTVSLCNRNWPLQKAVTVEHTENNWSWGVEPQWTHKQHSSSTYGLGSITGGEQIM